MDKFQYLTYSFIPTFNDMYPVYYNSGGEEQQYEEFFNKFMDVCLKHREQGRALMFAFILYDFKDAHIAKVLKDPDYWRSLDAISGNYVTVFSFHYTEKIIYKKRPYSNEPTLHRLVDVDVDNPGIAAENLLGRYFGDLDIKFPAMLFFQVYDDQILDYFLVPLDERDIEKSFNEVKKYLETAVGLLMDVTAKDNNKEIFEVVRLELDGISIKRVKKGLSNLSSVASFIKTIYPFIRYLEHFIK